MSRRRRGRGRPAVRRVRPRGTLERSRAAKARPSDADPAEPADPADLVDPAEQAETEAALESASTRTQEDVSKYMPPELPEDPADAKAPTGDVQPRYLTGRVRAHRQVPIG